ncbi:DUF397 domain-containing protein [Streptomyces phaeolivaceus]|uniref:DUF397 domain-containing protein n=1 Tax=Streptomyces phaeolivaceus TaxID=2653200 RepID=A0A5P8K3K8_9ACTN|nr:DUF397 domain-containing protein [Streptomyces phaeolivaceus]QFQ97855.1 DUF397 domain-containing protein [Streptomyces phaeolivaceus]
MRGPQHWQKSSFSGSDSGDDCVELAPTPTSIRIRESDHPAAVLTTTPTPLHALLTTLKAGTLDRS